MLSGRDAPNTAPIRTLNNEKSANDQHQRQGYLAASTGSACTSGIPEPSHVLRAIGLTREDAAESIRFSLGRGTTDTDVEEAIRLIDAVLARLANARVEMA
jgi:cysteine desulfurase